MATTEQIAGTFEVWNEETEAFESTDGVSDAEITDIEDSSGDDSGDGTISGGGTNTPLYGLPGVTTEDNGKFLMVVDGAWKAVALDDAEGGSY